MIFGFAEAVAAALDAGRKYINSLDLGGGGLSCTVQVLKIVNEKGLHARASAKFVEVVEAHEAWPHVDQGRHGGFGRFDHGAFDVGSIARDDY